MSSAHDRNITHELLAAVVACTRPAQLHISQFSAWMGEGLTGPSCSWEVTGRSWLLGVGDSVFSMDRLPNRLPVHKWASLIHGMGLDSIDLIFEGALTHTHTYAHTCTCIYTYMKKIRIWEEWEGHRRSLRAIKMCYIHTWNSQENKMKSCKNECLPPANARHAKKRRQKWSTVIKINQWEGHRNRTGRWGYWGSCYKYSVHWRKVEGMIAMETRVF